jgi:VWFA-related protein
VIVRLPVAAVAVLLATGAGEPDLQTGLSQYRAAIDLVTMNVSVHEGTRIKAGLAAADFELRDNGVVQTLRDFAREPLPLDVTLLIDLSGSVREDQRKRINEAANDVARSLGPADRGGLIVFAGRVAEHRPLMRPPFRVNLADPASLRVGTSLYDAVALALAAPPVPDRRSLLIVLTDGVDTTSFLDVPPLVDLARYTHPRVDLIIAHDDVTRATIKRMQEGRSSGSQSQLFTVLEQMLGLERSLEPVVDLTGGQVAVHGEGGDYGKAFLNAIEEFRSSYVLRYVATGVARGGWHDVTVTITRPGTFQVRTRKGYQS